MILNIQTSQAFGKATAPPSKSMAHRQLIAAALALEPRLVENLEWSDDILATLDCLRAMGASIVQGVQSVSIGGLDPFAVPEGTILPCRSSGSTLRFLIPLALLSGREVVFTGSDRLLERPLEPYRQICDEQRLFYDQQKNTLRVRGPLRPGNFKLPGNVSSQFVTGLFFALPFLNDQSIISLIPPIESRSYIAMSLAVQRDFGIRIISVGSDRFYIHAKQKYFPHSVCVEGDWSNAAFLDALNCFGGKVNVLGLNKLSLQGDKIYLQHFETLQQKKPIINISDCPDLGPVLMAVSAAYHGVVLEGTERLKFKESDRSAAMVEELKKFNIQALMDSGRIWVENSIIRTPTKVLDSHNDHRIAMALTVLCTLCGGRLRNAETVNKSWPRFYKVIQDLGILITPQEETESEKQGETVF